MQPFEGSNIVTLEAASERVWQVLLSPSTRQLHAVVVVQGANILVPVVPGSRKYLGTGTEPTKCVITAYVRANRVYNDINQHFVQNDFNQKSVLHHTHVNIVLRFYGCVPVHSKRYIVLYTLNRNAWPIVMMTSYVSGFPEL